MISRDVTITSTRFLHAGQGNVNVFTCISVICTGNETVRELRVVAQWRI